VVLPPGVEQLCFLRWAVLSFGGRPQLATYPQSPRSGSTCCCDVANPCRAFSQQVEPGRLWISLAAAWRWSWSESFEQRIEVDEQLAHDRCDRHFEWLLGSGQPLVELPQNAVVCRALSAAIYRALRTSERPPRMERLPLRAPLSSS